MPAVDIQGPQGGGSCRLFVSYAHQDEAEGGWPGRFMLHLRNLLPILARKGFQIQEEQIFYDSDRLRQAEKWPVAIAQALQECELFILLVSPHALASKFCIPTELQTVVARGVPVTTVLLHPTALWTERPVFFHRAAPLLGEYHSGGLPKAENNNTRPISDPGWPNVQAAWAKLGCDLMAFIEAQLPKQRPMVSVARSSVSGTPSVASGIPVAGGIAPELLPYFCDQQPLATDYETGLGRWKRSAQTWTLLVLFKGHYDDGLDKLAQRMRLKYLRTYFPGLPPASPLEWPEPDGLSRDQQVVGAVAALLTALGLDRSLVMVDGLEVAARALAAALRDRPHPIHLCASLPRSRSGLREAGPGVLGFLRFLDTVVNTEAGVMGRLVMDLIVEPESHELTVKLVKLWKLTGLQAAQVVEVGQPRPVDKTDVTNWHTQYVQPHFVLEREDLLQRFAAYFDAGASAAAPLRLKTFAKEVGRLLV